jgi:hypothetical protein
MDAKEAKKRKTEKLLAENSIASLMIFNLDMCCRIDDMIKELKQYRAEKELRQLANCLRELADRTGY